MAARKMGKAMLLLSEVEMPELPQLMVEEKLKFQESGDTTVAKLRGNTLKNVLVEATSIIKKFSDGSLHSRKLG